MSAITITEAAQDYLAELLSKQDTPGIGIRIFITQPGTQYAETCIAYCKPGEQKPEDTPVGLKDFTAYIDAISEPFLEDAIREIAGDRLTLIDTGHAVARHLGRTLAAAGLQAADPAASPRFMSTGDVLPLQAMVAALLGEAPMAQRVDIGDAPLAPAATSLASPAE